MKMKIQKLLTMSDEGLVRVQDFNNDDKKFLDEEKFREGTSRTGSPRHEADVYIIFCDEFDKMESQMNESQSQIQSLENDILEKDKRIKSLENELSSIHENHEKELKEVKDDLNERIKLLNKDNHKKDIEIEKVRTNSAEEIGRIKEANLNHINGLNLFDEDKHILIKDHNEEISKLKESQFNPESDMKISDHNLEINGIKNRIVKETIHHNDTINKLDSIGIWKFIKGDLKKVRNELKEDIQQYEYIAEYIESKNGNVILEIKKDEEK